MCHSHCLQEELLVVDVPIIEGVTPPRIVVEKVAAWSGDSDEIVLRNVGGQTQDLTGWKVTDSEDDHVYLFAQEAEGCEAFGSLAPSQKLELKQRADEEDADEDNPCGFSFAINFRDAIKVYNADGDQVTNVAWSDSVNGTVIRRVADDSYGVFRESENIIDTLEALGNFTVLLEILEALNFTSVLKSETDPEYDGVKIPEPPPPPPIDPQFPAWFGFTVNRSTLPAPPPPPPPPPPPKEGIPTMGPYTILAPTDDAFGNFRMEVAGPGNEPINVEALLTLPEFKDIILYHVLAGGWTSEFLKNNTGLPTAKVAEVVPFTDGAMTEGKLRLHDSCVDKPTLDGIDCLQQVEFEKCYDPFMVSPLGAQWPGGFCQRTCERCSCDPAAGVFCAEILTPDILASNGVIHSINRVLFPPPIFEPISFSFAPAPEEEEDDFPSTISIPSVPKTPATAEANMTSKTIENANE
ncbi:hypothetical protein BSKO_00771 [Bryopsis sp. KO-2023]|nr:hypothetical protein BSKO_00771 [Bryopsis sp. KO-2023]